MLPIPEAPYHVLYPIGSAVEHEQTAFAHSLQPRAGISNSVGTPPVRITSLRAALSTRRRISQELSAGGDCLVFLGPITRVVSSIPESRITSCSFSCAVAALSWV